MSKHQVRRRSTKHRGVRLIDRTDGRHLARWFDPVNGKERQQDLSVLGISNAPARLQWAVAKSVTLQSMRAKIAASGVTTARKPLADAVADYWARYANEGTASNKRIVVEAFAVFAAGKGAQDVQDVTVQMLASWRDHLLRPDSGWQRSTCNRWLVCTRTFLNWCDSHDWLPDLNEKRTKAATKRAPEPVHAIKILFPVQLRTLFESC